MSPVQSPARWECAFPASRRSLLANLVLSAVRSGDWRQHSPPGAPCESDLTPPAAVAVEVRREVLRRLANLGRYGPDPRTPQDRAFYERLAADLETLTPEVLDYLAYRLDWDAHPREEKARLRARGGLPPAGELPPTQRQIDFLRALGDEGDAPANRAEASVRINERLARRGGGS